MKKIYLFKNDAASLIEENSPHVPTFNGENSIQIIDATEDNIKKYFQKEIDKSKITIKK